MPSPAGLTFQLWMWSWAPLRPDASACRSSRGERACCESAVFPGVSKARCSAEGHCLSEVAGCAQRLSRGPRLRGSTAPTSAWSCGYIARLPTFGRDWRTGRLRDTARCCSENSAAVAWWFLPVRSAGQRRDLVWPVRNRPLLWLPGALRRSLPAQPENAVRARCSSATFPGRRVRPRCDSPCSSEQTPSAATPCVSASSRRLRIEVASTRARRARLGVSG
mmetsp:Transcript_38010/g.83466  ORF Transcript_38010/g.83466 Transcript_38010/m.83466 type:complete len:221 (+) Transcript_38010:260-922(+)